MATKMQNITRKYVRMPFVLLGLFFLTMFLAYLTLKSSSDWTTFKRGTQKTIRVAWSFTEAPSAKQLKTLGFLSKVWPSAYLEILCANEHCRKAVSSMNEKTQISTAQLNVFKLTKDTPLSRWIERHPAIKIQSGYHYEGHLQKVLQLALLWKFGGIVFDAEASIRNKSAFIERARQISSGTCISVDNLPFGMCYIEKPGHHHIGHMINVFLHEYMIKGPSSWPQNYHIRPVNDSWPYSFDFSSLIKKSLENCNNRCSPIAFQETSDCIFHKPIHQKTRFGLISYRNLSVNIGDEIQSIGTAHLLPRVDYFTPRENLPTLPFTNITVVMNAFWPKTGFIYNPQKSIHPILAAVHIDNDGIKDKVAAVQQFFHRYGPVGTRDTASLKIFEDLGIPAVFTGCITLWIQNPYKQEQRKDNIYIVDAGYYQGILPEHVKKSGITLTHEGHLFPKDHLLRFQIGEKLLQMYAQAKVVITTRIHVALPCVALGTPVIFLNSDKLYRATHGHPSPRVTGLLDLFHTIDFYKTSVGQGKEILNSFQWDAPPPNPNHELFLKLKQVAWGILSKNEYIRDSVHMYDIPVANTAE